jgi:hypothetical protein
MVAETVTLAMYYPYELVKVRIVTKNDEYNYKSIPDAFKRIVQESGIRGLYTGA